MRYLMLILGDEKQWEKLSEKDMAAMYEQYGAFSEEIAKKARNVSGDELHPTAMAAAIRVRDGKPRVTDGPFTEVKEVVGGYYLFDAETLEEALALAAKCPGARTGTIELYAVKPMPG